MNRTKNSALRRQALADGSIVTILMESPLGHLAPCTLHPTTMLLFVPASRKALRSSLLSLFRATLHI